MPRVRWPLRTASRSLGLGRVPVMAHPPWHPDHPDRGRQRARHHASGPGSRPPDHARNATHCHRLDRVLLTNDDGVDAPGLAVLERAAAELAEEVWVVAPAHDQSGTSHSISLHSPLRLARLGDRRFSVVGTPGDCTVMAVRHLMREDPPDLVLSGVNRGANLGIETVFSGTVGAAMTAMLLGLPAIALSQAFRDRKSTRLN